MKIPEIISRKSLANHPVESLAWSSNPLNLSNGQKEQLELDLGHLSFHVFIGETQVDPRSVDVPMPQLLLEGIKPPTAVQEVDGIAVPEEMSMDVALES